MSNVIHVPFTTPKERAAAALEPLLRGFATSRRRDTDVLWLKENGELLNILESTGSEVPHSFLEVYEAAYEALPEKLAFFPQYYRFLLSLALDLEALGLSGDHAAQMCAWVSEQGLVGAETSDIQRAEARRLLDRRGQACLADPGLDDRLRAFIRQSDRFALPNKKAAYELTHIVFYLSEYGRKDPQLDANAVRSLKNVGIWAFLDGNVDLLSEICIAMRFAKCNPSDTWEAWISLKMSERRVMYRSNLERSDSYHQVFMASWLEMLRGGAGLMGFSPLSSKDDGVLHLEMPGTRRRALREMSQSLFTLGASRSGDWGAMQGPIGAAVSEESNAVIAVAQDGSSDFEVFFESFARATQVRRA